MKILICGIALASTFLPELALANLFEVKKAVEDAQCKKLAATYAKEPHSLPVSAIARLQICLAQSIQAMTSTIRPRNLDIQPPRSFQKTIETTLPTPPTSPTPPQAIKIK